MTEWDPSEPTHTCLHCGRTTLVDSEVCEWCGAPNTPDPAADIPVPRVVSMILFFILVLPLGCVGSCMAITISAFTTGQLWVGLIVAFAIMTGVAIIGRYAFRK